MTAWPDLSGVKVAHLATVDISLEFLLLPQMRATIEAGAEVIGISAVGPSVERVAQAGIRHVPLPSSTRAMDPLADLRAARELVGILRTERPDVLHTHTPKPGIYGRIVGGLTRVPAVVNTVHGLYAVPDDPRARRAAVYGLEAIASRFSDAELVQNEEDLALMRRLRLAPRSHLHLLGNGVDLKRFDATSVPEAARQRIRAEIGAADSDIVVGTVARLEATKGLRELIAAAALLEPNVRVVAVGDRDADKADALTEDEMRRGQEAGVRFLGQRSDVREIYAAMDIALLASYGREGVPRALMEPAAMGKPLVTTDVRGNRQVVRHKVNGLVVPPRDHGALAGAINQLARSAEDRANYGLAARKRAEAEFDEAKVIQTILETYDRLLESRSRTRTP